MASSTPKPREFDAEYQGIVFPDRAEALRENTFEHYKVFLRHWSRIAEALRQRYEDLAIRNATHCLLIFGPQGSGKTLLSQKLIGDHALWKARETGDTSDLTADNNLWSLVTGSSRLSADLIARATQNTTILDVRDSPTWVQDAKSWKANNTDRNCIVIADNAERQFFLQSLLGMTTAEYLGVASNRSEVLRLAAQTFVALCRTDLRGMLMVALTNDAAFAKEFLAEVEAQHRGLLALEHLDLPDSKSKETVVRVNINRLNPVSYWYCLDRAGPAEKQRVFETLTSAETYPAAFRSVDFALKNVTSQRGGRPARKNQLTFVALTDSQTASDFDQNSFDVTAEEIIIDYNWCKLVRYSKWATAFAGKGISDRQLQFCASEWDLRILFCGEPFVAALLSTTTHPLACKRIIDHSCIYHGPGTLPATKDAHRAEFERLIDVINPFVGQHVPEFWAKGQVRNHDYERALRQLYPDKFDSVGSTTMSFRPDLIISPFIPCGILNAEGTAKPDLNQAIRRDANMVEFTAIREYQHLKLVQYISSKITNYIEITQEQ